MFAIKYKFSLETHNITICEKLTTVEEISLPFLLNHHESANITFPNYTRLYPFLDASSHLYKRVCPSVGPSVCDAFFFKFRK